MPDFNVYHRRVALGKLYIIVGFVYRIVLCSQLKCAKEQAIAQYMKRRFLVNSTTGFFQVVINTVLTVATIPVFLSLLGKELYGVFSLITTVTLVGSFVNFGFNVILIKFISEQGHCVRSDRDIVVSFSLAGILVIVVVIIGLVFGREILENVLRIPQQQLTLEISTLYNLILISNIFLLLGEIPIAVLDSLQKIYITNALQIVNILLNKGGIFIVLLFGGKFTEIGVVFLGSSVIWFILIAYFFSRYWKFTSFYGCFVDYFKTVKKHITYGLKVYFTSLSVLFYEPFTKILISRYIGVTEVGVFDIAFKLKNVMWSVLTKVIHPFTPLLASYYEPAKIRLIVDRLSKVLLVVTLPIIVGVIFITEPIITLWLGEGNDLIIFSTVTILSGYVVLISSLPIYQFLLIKNHPEKNFYIQILNALMSFIFFIISVPKWGYTAAVYSFVAAVLSTNVLSIYYQKYYLNSVSFLPFKNVLQSCLIALLLYTFNTVIEYFIHSNLIRIMIIFPSNGILLFVMILYLNIVTHSDLQWFFRKNI